MKIFLPLNGSRRDKGGLLKSHFAGALLGAQLFLAGCSSGLFDSIPAMDPVDPGRAVQTPANFDAALLENQSMLDGRKGARDLALYNMGVILAHPSNPKKDQTKALQSFRAVVTEHPRSKWVEQSKTWIQVLEQQQKIADEKQQLAEEKRALSRERELLLQERQKLNYASERSRQLDLEIDKRRRQSRSK